VLAVNRAFGPVENNQIKFSQLVLVDSSTGRIIRRLDALSNFQGGTGNAGWAPDGTQAVFGRTALIAVEDLELPDPVREIRQRCRQLLPGRRERPNVLELLRQTRIRE
jgi:hypothetical protein